MASLEEELHARSARLGPTAARRWYSRQALGIGWRAAVGSIGRGPGTLAHAGRPPSGLGSGLRELLRHASRSALRRRSVSGAVILATALAVGAVTAVASVVDAVLLRSLPYPDPDRIVWLNSGSEDGTLNGMANPWDVLDWRAAAGSFAVIAPYATRQSTAELEIGPVRVGVAEVGEGMDRVLGVRAQVGRLLAPADYAEGVRSAVVTDAFWRQRLGGAPDAVGRSLVLGGVAYTLVGVLPPSPLPFPPGQDVWLGLAEPRGEAGTRRAGVWLRVVGRVRPDVPLATARAEMEAVVARLRQTHPDTNRGRTIEVIPLRDGIVGPARPVVLLMAGAVGVVLLIAAANVGGLLLAAAQDRLRELAIRTTLGASTGRLAALILSESVALAAAGGVLGMLLAPLGIRGLLTLYPGGLPRGSEVEVDGRVLAVAVAVTLGTALAAGLPPLLQARRLDPGRSLRARERGAGSRSDRRTRAVLVAAQVALSVVLLVGGGLFLRTFQVLGQVEPGFDAAGTLTFNVALPVVRYPTIEEEAAFGETLLAGIRELPGVEAAGTASLLPLTANDWIDGFLREGTDDAFPDAPVARLQAVSAGWVEALGLPLLRGRALTGADGPGAPYVVMVNETFERSWFGEGALGRRISLQGQWREIVGITGDKRHRTLREEPMPELFVPRGQIWNPRSFAWVAVRTGEGSPDPLPAVRRVLGEIDGRVALENVRTMDARLADARAPERFRAWLVGTLALLALTLTAIGIYGLSAYAVGRESRDIGVRIALGRRPGAVLSATVGRAVLVAVSGAAVGLGVALAGARVIATLVPEVGPRDPLTLAAVPLVVVAVAAAAALGPARRAARVDPAVTLRPD